MSLRCESHPVERRFDGFAGQSFAAILGCQQSMLESLLLKRRIMGPSWISLQHPTRIDPAAQVCLCRLHPLLHSSGTVRSCMPSECTQNPMPGWSSIWTQEKPCAGCFVE